MGLVKTSIDSDGVEHKAVLQNSAMSCGPAAVYMLDCLAKGKPIGSSESSITQISARFPGSLLESNLLSGIPGGDFGTMASNLQKVLATLGLVVRLTETWNSVSDRLPGGLQTSMIKSRSPALVLIGWYQFAAGKWKRDGGHFLVASRVTRSSRIVYLDPGDGLARECANNGRYLSNGFLESALYLRS